MRWLDLAYVRLSPRLRCFEDGWGDEAQLAEGLDATWRSQVPEPASITWTRARVHGDVAIREGQITSPEAGLPAESRLARVRLLSPRSGATGALALALAAWGDEGFDARRRVYGPALAQGVSLLFLENPLYGGRRRIGQRGAELRTVSDFVLMGRATVAETRALLAWARAEGYPRTGVVGFSMGGQMAAMSAALCPWPIRVVAVAPSATPATVFLDGPLGVDLQWSLLGPGGRDRLREILEALSVLALPPPVAPEHAHLVGTRGDAIVRPGDVGAIARHWGVHPRWIDDGHVSAIAMRPHAIAQSVIDAFAPEG